jgi:O-antigen/teichoic acid export membrane protein
MHATTKIGVDTCQAPVRGQSLHANFWWVFAGNATYSLCQWMIVVALAKLGSPLMLGQFALGLAIASPVLTFTNLHLRAVQATDARRQYRFSEYLGLRIINTAAGWLIIGLIALAGNFDSRTAAIVMAVGLAKAMESFSDLFYGLFQQREQLRRTAISMILRGLLAVVTVTASLAITKDVFWSAIALMATWGLVWAVYDVRWGRRILGLQSSASGKPITEEGNPLKPRFDAARLWSLSRLALPLGVVMLMLALFANTPRYFIQHSMGEESLGVYSAMAYAMVAVTGVAEALGHSATPRLSRYYAGGQIARFRSLLMKLLVLGIALGAAAIATSSLGGSSILALLYRPQYAQHADVFVWLTIAAALTCVAWMLNFGLTAARHFKIQVPMFGAVLLTTAAGCYLLVPTMGMRGAAVSLALGALAHVVLASAILARVLNRSEASEREVLVAAGSQTSPAVEIEL